MLFSATWRQKSQKIDFMNVFHGFIGFGSETANIFNTWRGSGRSLLGELRTCRSVALSRMGRAVEVAGLPVALATRLRY